MSTVFVARDSDLSLIGVYSSVAAAERGLLAYVSLPGKPGWVMRTNEIDQFTYYRITDRTVSPADVAEVTLTEIGLDA